MGHSLDSTEKPTSASALDPMTTSNASVPLGRRQSMACMQVRDAAAAELLVISVASRRRTGTDFRSSHLSSIPSLDLLSTSKHAPLGPTCSSHEQDKPRHCHVAASSMHKTLFNRGHRDLTDLVLGVVRVAQASPSGQSSTRVEAMSVLCTSFLIWVWVWHFQRARLWWTSGRDSGVPKPLRDLESSFDSHDERAVSLADSHMHPPRPTA